MDPFLYYAAGRLDVLQQILVPFAFVYAVVYLIGAVFIVIILLSDDLGHEREVKAKKLLWVGTILFILLSVLALILPNGQELTNLIHEMYGR